MLGMLGSLACVRSHVCLKDMCENMCSVISNLPGHSPNSLLCQVSQAEKEPQLEQRLGKYNRASTTGGKPLQQCEPT